MMAFSMRFHCFIGTVIGAIGLAAFAPPASAQVFWSDQQLSSGVLGQGVSVTIDSAGNALAAWSDMPDPYHDYVYSSSRPNGGPWGVVQQSSVFGSAPILHMAASGVVTAIWYGAQGLVAADRATTGIWSSPVVIGKLSVAPFTFKMNAHGDAVVAGQIGGNDAGTSVWAVRRIGGVWQALTTVSVPGLGQNQVRFDDAAMGETGDALVVYEDYSRLCGPRACSVTNYQAHASRGTGSAGGTWTDSGALNPGIGILGYYAKAAVDEHGRAIVMYPATPSGASYPTALTYRLQPGAGKAWHQPVVAYTQTASSGEGVGAIGAITGANGDVTILFDDALGIIAPLKAVDGNLKTAKWGTPVMLSTPNGSGSSVVFGQNPAGEAAVGWDDIGGTVYAVTRAGFGSLWGTSQAIQQSGFSCSLTGLQCNTPMQMEVNDAGQDALGIDSISGVYTDPNTGAVVVDRAVEAAVNDQ